MRWEYLLCFMLIIGGVGCKDRKKDLILGGPPQPDLTGKWTGSMTINGTTSQVEFSLTQNDINVQGTYGNKGSNLFTIIGSKGSSEGATTGSTFALKIQPEDAGCQLTLQAGGQNDGTTLSFSLTGSDCGGASLRGQSTLNKS